MADDNQELQDMNAATEEAEQQVETDIQGLYDQIDRLTGERDQLKDQVLRAMADFQNFRKRNQTEMQTFRQFAAENFARELLPVLDNFERTLAHLRGGASVESVTEGITAVERQFRSVLEGQNVRRIPAVGEAFDTTYHEALGFDESSEYPDGTVSSEIEAGYRMGDKVIRPARVRVAKQG